MAHNQKIDPYGLKPYTGGIWGVVPVKLKEDPEKRQKIEYYEDYLADFLLDLQSKRRSNNTLHSFILDVCSFLQFIHPTKLTHINKGTANRWLMHLQDKELKNSTIMRHVSSVRSFLNFLSEYYEDEFVRSPARFLKDVDLTVDRKIVFFDKEQLNDFVRCSSLCETTEVGIRLHAVRDTLVIMLMGYLGFRVGEVRLLDVTDLDLNSNNPTVTIQTHKTKSKKGRTLPLQQPMVTLLKNFIKSHRTKSNSEALFLNSKGQRLGRKTYEDIFKKTLRVFLKDPRHAHLKDQQFTAHKLRHSFATALANDPEIPIHVVAALLGHQSVATTMIYTHTSQKQNSSALQKTFQIDPLNSMPIGNGSHSPVRERYRVQKEKELDGVQKRRAKKFKPPVSDQHQEQRKLLASRLATQFLSKRRMGSSS